MKKKDEFQDVYEDVVSFIQKKIKRKRGNIAIATAKRT